MSINTIKTYTLDGAAVRFPVTFEYLARKFVKVTLLGTLRRPLTLVTEYVFENSTQIRLLTAWGPADGYDTVEIRRETSAVERIVTFNDATVLRASDLNVSEVQALHIAEEARDARLDFIGLDDDGNVDARFRRVVNLADPVNPRDAVNLQSVNREYQGIYDAATAAQATANAIDGKATLALSQSSAAVNGVYGRRTDLQSSLGSTLVGTILSGTGAAYRTQAGKNNDHVNVQDFSDVPLSGTGVDATPAFNRAILYQSRRGGGKVSAQGSFWLASPVFVPSNIDLDGGGWTYLRGNGKGSQDLLRAGWVDRSVDPNGVLKDLTLEYGTGTTGSGFNYASNVTIRGFRLGMCRYGILTQRFNWGCQILNCWFEADCDYGWVTRQSWGLRISGCTIFGYVRMGDFVDWTQVVGCSFEGPSSRNLKAAIIIEGSYGGSYSAYFAHNGFHHYSTAFNLRTETNNLTITGNHSEDVQFFVSGGALNTYRLHVHHNWIKANLGVAGACIGIYLANAKDSQLGPNSYVTDGTSTFDAYVIAETTDCWGNTVGEQPYNPLSGEISRIELYRLGRCSRIVQLSGSNNTAISQPIIEQSTGDGAFTFEKYRSRYNFLPNRMPYCTIDTSGATWTIDTWVTCDVHGLRSMVAYNFTVNGASAYIIGGFCLGLSVTPVANTKLFGDGPAITVTAGRSPGGFFRITLAGVPAGGNVTGWVKQL